MFETNAEINFLSINFRGGRGGKGEGFGRRKFGKNTLTKIPTTENLFDPTHLEIDQND